MSYMLISHGPSPLLQMGLWDDILSHPLASKDQVIPRKYIASIPAWQAATTSPSPPRSGPYLGLYSIPAVVNPWEIMPSCRVLSVEFNNMVC